MAVEEDPEGKVRVKSAPVPVSAMVWGLLPALWVRIIDPVRVPLAVGAKVTLIVQSEPAATLAPQALVCAKSPLAVMLVTAKGEFPVLLRITPCAAEVELTS